MPLISIGARDFSAKSPDSLKSFAEVIKAGKSGKPVLLTLTEFWILSAIARRPGHLKTHEQLMDAANAVVTNNTITAHIRRIRNKFREIDPDFDHIRSEYGMGYRWHSA